MCLGYIFSNIFDYIKHRYIRSKYCKKKHFQREISKEKYVRENPFKTKAPVLMILTRNFFEAYASVPNSDGAFSTR